VDEATVKQRAGEHAQAIVQGDLGRAASDLSDEAKSQAPAVMKELPRPVTTAAVIVVTPEGDDLLTDIRYYGETEAVTVRSRWSDRGGDARIVELQVI
jgi:hypothetical protein